MQIKILEETKVIEKDGWITRVRPPTGQWNNRIILMLHGWTGDENIMWIFARRLPQNSWLISPRAPLVCPEGGYAWAIPVDGHRPEVTQFSKHSRELLKVLPNWVPGYTQKTRLDVMGFSQGAAMTYSMCLDIKPTKIAPLAGYLPPGFEQIMQNRDLTGLRAFIAHNTDDSVVSVEESKNAARLFSEHGAEVEYCDGTGGHKLNSSCFHGLDEFLKD